MNFRSLSKCCEWCPHNLTNPIQCVITSSCPWTFRLMLYISSPLFKILHNSMQTRMLKISKMVKWRNGRMSGIIFNRYYLENENSFFYETCLEETRKDGKANGQRGPQIQIKEGNTLQTLE